MHGRAHWAEGVATIPADADGASFRFSTEGVPPAQRFSYFRETVGRALSGYEFEPLADSFSCEVSLRLLPHLSVSEIASAPMRATRTREPESDRTKDLTLLISRGEGAVAVSQLQRETTLEGAGAVLLSRADPLSMESAGSRQIFVSMRRTDLEPMIPNLDAALMSPLPGDGDAMRMLTRYLDLVAFGDATSPELRRAAVTHIHDLIALTLGATRDAAEIANGRGVRAARVRAIKADIVQNFGNGDVSAAALAKRHRVTPRYVHKLFESEGVTLSRFVLGQRLARVHRMLTDPRHATRTVGAIAYSVGFSDLSTFNREFRRHFGATPSDVRAAARN